jgi:hypothetical protein
MVVSSSSALRRVGMRCCALMMLLLLLLCGGGSETVERMLRDVLVGELRVTFVEFSRILCFRSPQTRLDSVGEK